MGLQNARMEIRENLLMKGLKQNFFYVTLAYLVVRWLLGMLLAALMSTFKWVKITKCH